MKTRKILSGISALVLAATMAVPFSAFAEDTAINTNGGSGNTNVIYDATEKYFVTIPAGVTLKDTAVTADITASGVIIGEGKIIKVSLTKADNTSSGNQFNANNSDKTSTVSYNINNGAVSVGDVIAKFDKDNLSKTLTFTKTDDVKPTHAGKHSENLTFTIGVENAKTDVSSVTITDTSTTTLTKGGTLNLTATVDESATDKTVTWTSSNENVATVDNTGEVTAIASGTAIITVTATNGTEDTSDDQTDSITITVTNPVTNINIPATLGLVTGKSGNLTATVAPPDADDTTVTWTSSDENVATVDNTGKVTAIASGTATITATIGDKTATCQVTVATVPTLADAFKKDAIVKINYVFRDDDNSCTFKSNGDGTYTFISGTGYDGSATDEAKELKADNNNLIFKQNFFETIDKYWGEDGFSITFDKSNNTYSEWKGSEVKPHNYDDEEDMSIGDASFKAIEVNGVNITSILSKQ